MNNGATKNKSNVLVEPWVTEAATLAMEINKYVFRVDLQSSKGEIRNAVESIYGVKVVSVNTVRIPRKFKNYGQTPGWKAGFKKAIVTIKEGDKIELFESK